MVKAIATDMDGTFLDGEGCFDRVRFSSVLDRLEKKNIPFIVASGNGIERLLQLCQGFEDRILFIADNGAHIYQDGKTSLRRGVTAEEISSVLDYFQGNWGSVCLMLGNDQRIYLQSGGNRPFIDTDLPIQEEQLQSFQEKIVYLEDLSQYPLEESIYKIGLWVSEQEVDQITNDFNAVFQGKLFAVTSGYGSVDILPEGIHKAWGLGQVLEELSISPEHVMAFGDSDNDIELLAYAGHSYAMENATDKVKAVAKFIAPSHLEAGVMQVIEERVLSQI